MKYVSPKKLQRKKIITDEGREIGTLVEIMVDENTGKIEKVLIEPNFESDYAANIKQNADGLIELPYDAIMAVTDHIIADRRKIPA